MNHVIRIALFCICLCSFFTSGTQDIVSGDATIRENCIDGKINGPDGSCLYEVYFHSQNSMSLDQAKAKAAHHGWSLATADELTAAYNKLRFNHFAYGMLADGRMAIPIQSDVNEFKRGTNIGITGGNQGFFYTIKPGTPVVPLPPPPPTNATSDPLSGGTLNIITGPPIDQVAENKAMTDYFNNEFFKLRGMPYEGSKVQQYDQFRKKYEKGVGNIIQDKWSDANYSPILSNALKAFVAEKFPRSYKANNSHLLEYVEYLIKNKDENCTDCKKTRYEFVGFFVPEYLKMLRTKSNPELSKQFFEYVSFNLAKANRQTLEAWQYYSRSTTAQLNERPYIPGFYLNEDSGPSLIDPADIEAVEYDNSMRNIIIGSGVPLGDKSVAEFKTCCMGGSPMYFTHKQEIALMDFIMPVTAQSFPDNPAVKDILSIPNYFSRNLHAEAEALHMIESFAVQTGTSLGIGATALTAAGALNAFHTSIVAATNTSKLVVDGIALKATIHSAKLMSKAIGPALGNMLGPVSFGVGVFMIGFMPTGGKAIEIAAFENSLKAGCYIQPREKEWVLPQHIRDLGLKDLGAGSIYMTEGEKIENFTFLFKMLVLDPQDFTYLIPERTAGRAEQRRLESLAAQFTYNRYAKDILATLDDRYNIPEIHVYSEPNLSLVQAENLASFHNWKLATPDQVYDGWVGGLDAYGFLRMSDGQFAVPVQTDHSNFKKGANIGATGGNQGFLYTVYKQEYKRIQNRWKESYIQSNGDNAIEGAKLASGNADRWKIIQAGEGNVRIQSLNNPEHYLNFSGNKLEVVPIKPNWVSALWKLEPVGGDLFRIQNQWYKDKYIHNQNGTLEVGEIHPNWWSTRWRLE